MTEQVVDMIRDMIKQNHPMATNYRFSRMVTAWESGINPILRGAPALIVAHAPKNYAIAPIDCTIALTFLDLAAPMHGLGTCWAGFFMIAAAMCKPLEQALGLPQGHAIQGALMAGYPKYQYYSLPPRDEPKIAWL